MRARKSAASAGRCRELRGVRRRRGCSGFPSFTSRCGRSTAMRAACASRRVRAVCAPSANGFAVRSICTARGCGGWRWMSVRRRCASTVGPVRRPRRSPFGPEFRCCWFDRGVSRGGVHCDGPLVSRSGDRGRVRALGVSCLGAMAAELLGRGHRRSGQARGLRYDRPGRPVARPGLWRCSSRRLVRLTERRPWGAALGCSRASGVRASR